MSLGVSLRTIRAQACPSSIFRNCAAWLACRPGPVLAIRGQTKCRQDRSWPTMNLKLLQRRKQCNTGQLGVKNLSISRQETSKNLARFIQVMSVGSPATNARNQFHAIRIFLPSIEEPLMSVIQIIYLGRSSTAAALR